MHVLVCATPQHDRASAWEGRPPGAGRWKSLSCPKCHIGQGQDGAAIWLPVPIGGRERQSLLLLPRYSPAVAFQKLQEALSHRLPCERVLVLSGGNLLQI